MNWLLFFEIHSHELRYIMLPSKIGWNFTEQTRLGFIFDDMQQHEHCIVAIFFHSDSVQKKTNKQTNKKKTHTHTHKNTVLWSFITPFRAQ